jgi:hypothetical protein
MSVGMKEPSFFAFPERGVSEPLPHPDPYIRDWSEYTSLFDGATDETVVGESSVLYLQVPEAPSRIMAKLGHIKLLVLLRDPAERAYSHFLLHRSTNDEPCDSLGEAIAAWTKRSKSGWRINWDYVEPGYYAEHLSRYFREFGREWVKVVLFDELRLDPNGVLADICRFVGVSDQFAFDTSRKLNGSRVPRRTPLAACASLAIRRQWQCPVSAGASIRSRIAAWLCSKVTERPTMPVADRAALIETYRDDIARLEKLIGKDLRAWTELAPAMPVDFAFRRADSKSEPEPAANG